MTDNSLTQPSSQEDNNLGGDIVVIGSSAGGVEALKELVSHLPAGFPAPILVVIHIPINATSVLPRILTRAGQLTASHAIDTETLKPGHIYVAPPNNHLFVVDHTASLQTGPRINGVRPAIDALFQSAAKDRGSRVIGVILSGTLDDGVAGLAAIKEQGGITIVQDPDTALFSALPANAIHNVNPDFILPLDQIARKLTDLVTERQMEEALDPNLDPTDLETRDIEKDILSYENGDLVSMARTVLTCPECGGILWEYKAGKMLQYRCHVGHIYSEETIFSEQDGALEIALWTAMRVLRERAFLARRLASRAREGGRLQSESLYFEQARKVEESANQIRKLLSELPGTKN